MKIFKDQILSKYIPNRTICKNFLRGHAPEPPYQGTSCVNIPQARCIFLSNIIPPMFEHGLTPLVSGGVSGVVSSDKLPTLATCQPSSQSQLSRQCPLTKPSSTKEPTPPLPYNPPNNRSDSPVLSMNTPLLCTLSPRLRTCDTAYQVLDRFV